jgi:hypothetical protein
VKVKKKPGNARLFCFCLHYEFASESSWWVAAGAVAFASDELVGGRGCRGNSSRARIWKPHRGIVDGARTDWGRMRGEGVSLALLAAPRL